MITDVDGIPYTVWVERLRAKALRALTLLRLKQCAIAFQLLDQSARETAQALYSFMIAWETAFGRGGEE